jgi:ABC-type multidrug transport system permease subunit
MTVKFSYARQEIYVGVELQFNVFLTPLLMEMLTFLSRQFYPVEIAPGTHYVRGFNGPGAVLVFWRRQIACLCRETNPTSFVVQPVAQSLYQLH